MIANRFCAFCQPISLPTSTRTIHLRTSNVTTIHQKPQIFRRRLLRIPPTAKTSPDQQTPPSTNTSISNSSTNNTSTNNTPTISEPAPSNLQKDIFATISWIAVAAGCAGFVTATRGLELGIQFITAYVVEYSLSVDNLFVFLLIFDYFLVDRDAQPRVLTWGILGAMAMRGAMIIAGTELIKRSHFISLVFAALLIYSAANILLSNDEEEQDLSNNNIVKFWKKVLPFSEKYDGDRFFTKSTTGWVATPLLLVLLCIEASDVVFALDSVPAVLGISEDSGVIYASNILAIAGLRNLYFILKDAIGELRFLQQSLAVVLSFVGGKMAAGVFGVEVGTLQSLGVVVGTLAAGVGLSLAFPEEEEGTEAQ